ncbi:MAG: glycosyltransferase family 2 protein [Bacillota bacterium]
MVSTKKNIVSQMPQINPEGVCGCFITCPAKRGLLRKAEGGMRLQGRYKTSRLANPLVSIITVVFNRVHTLERAIKSVLRQTYDNIEYIIIDGGSMDGTVETIEKYRDLVDYYVSESDDGIYDAINKGLSLASGDYIGILNSDDWYSTDAVKVSVNAILRSKADYSGADEFLVDESGAIVKNYGIYNFNDAALFSLNPCNHGTMFISKKVYDEMGLYDTSLRIAADLKYQLAMISRGYKAAVIRRPIHYYELSGISCKDQKAAVHEVKKILSGIHSGLNGDEIEIIVRLRYYDELSPAALTLIEKIIKGDAYNQNQKNYLVKRVLEICRNQLLALQSNQGILPDKPESLSIRTLLFLLFIAVKRKLSKILKYTAFFRPAKRMYSLIRHFPMKYKIHRQKAER